MDPSNNGPVGTTLNTSPEFRNRAHAKLGMQVLDGAGAAVPEQQLHPSQQRNTSNVCEGKNIKSPPKRSPSWASLAAITMQVSLHDWILIATMIFGGCCSNVFALEILVNDAPKSGQMITFAQFMCVSAYGLVMHLQWPIIQEWWAPTSQTPKSADFADEKTTVKGSDIWRFIPHLKPRKIPITRWLAIVIMFFSVSVLNNLSLAYKISVPLHIIFRSGGLMVGMVLGMILMKKRYSKSQMFAVLIVTLGVVYATTSAKTNNSQKSSSGYATKSRDVSAGDYAIGVFMLTVALIISSLMGLLQETTYQTYGSEWREGLFYSRHS
ncbi:golgi uridine diphosphate-N- acetylglucosamine transporter [Mortierella sp. GBA30]|nr:golgi uridine diphosphate-N- acetylglucosamine transporter [Mortierella sp. GBA30]